MLTLSGAVRATVDPHDAAVKRQRHQVAQGRAEAAPWPPTEEMLAKNRAYRKQLDAHDRQKVAADDRDAAEVRRLEKRTQHYKEMVKAGRTASTGSRHEAAERRNKQDLARLEELKAKVWVPAHQGLAALMQHAASDKGKAYVPPPKIHAVAAMRAKIESERAAQHLHKEISVDSWGNMEVDEAPQLRTR